MSKKDKNRDKKKTKGNYRKDENTESDNSIAPKKSLGLVKFFVPMFIAGAYVVGVSFYQGLLNAQGFSADHFPISIDERYLMAYYALVIYLFSTVEPLNGFWESVFAIDWRSVITLLSIAIVIHIFARLIIYERKPKKPVDKDATLEPSIGWHLIARRVFFEPLITFGIMYAMLISTLLALLVIIYLTGVISLPNSVGLQHGLKLSSDFQKNGCVFHEQTRWSECIEIRDGQGKVIHRGKLVARYQNSIGLLEETTLRSLVYPLKSDDQIFKYMKAKSIK